jgi:hypothetical protein
MATTSTLAKMAFFELHVARQRELLSQYGAQAYDGLPPDFFEAATGYASRAFAVLAEMGSGYDPEAHSRTLAEEAVVIYVKMKLSGIEPISHPDFLRATNLWSRNAAKQS